MSIMGRIGTQLGDFLCPCATKLRAAITTFKITNIAKIDFNISGIHIPC
jgi:hypothetical protein